MIRISLKEYEQWRVEFFRSQRGRFERLGQAFLNDHKGTDPDLYYKEANSSCDRMIREKYVSY